MLLNTRTGHCWQTNNTGACVLEHLLAGGTGTSAADELRRRPSAADRAAQDTLVLLSIAQGSETGALVSLPVARDGPAQLSFVRRCLVLACVAMARVLTARAPRILCHVLETVRRGARPATEPQAARARHAVVTVSARCAGNGCLQRSVATALLCRLQGQWPQWCMGVRTEPFRAHAWVVVDGFPVGEPDDIRFCQPMLTVPR
ncbi:lasso peptide biosynthesis B2 protein [Streptomyces kanamyceticus]|uniref:lasso peptide biosynthesis B2 protein n=1 Tax=Streptomyces kanamyceticus TaxID=1967 RepID=UPI0037DCD007